MAKYTKGQSGNPRGRPKGSTGKVPTNKEIVNSFKIANKTALLKLLHIMENGQEEAQFKAAVKIADITYNLVLAEESKNNNKNVPTGNGQTPSEEEKPKARVMTLSAVRN